MRQRCHVLRVLWATCVLCVCMMTMMMVPPFTRIINKERRATRTIENGAERRRRRRGGGGFFISWFNRPEPTEAKHVLVAFAASSLQGLYRSKSKGAVRAKEQDRNHLFRDSSLKKKRNNQTTRALSPLLFHAIFFFFSDIKKGQ